MSKSTLAMLYIVTLISSWRRSCDLCTNTCNKTFKNWVSIPSEKSVWKKRKDYVIYDILWVTSALPFYVIYDILWVTSVLPFYVIYDILWVGSILPFYVIYDILWVTSALPFYVIYDILWVTSALPFPNEITSTIFILVQCTKKNNQSEYQNTALNLFKGCHGRMVVGFTATYAISAY